MPSQKHDQKEDFDVDFETPSERTQPETGQRSSNYVPYSYGRHRRRTTYTPEQLAVMDEKYKNDPYMDEKARDKLAKSLGLSGAQLKVWFQNRRAKDKRNSRSYDESMPIPIRSSKIRYGHSTNLKQKIAHVRPDTRGQASQQTNDIKKSWEHRLSKRKENPSLFHQISAFDPLELAALTNRIHEKGTEAYNKLTETFD